MMAWAVSSMRDAHVPFLDSIASASRNRRSDQIGEPQFLGDILWAMAKCSVEDVPLIAALSSEAIPLRSEFGSLESMSGTAWSLAILGNRDVPLLTAIAASSINRSSQFTPETLGRMSWAFATCAFVHYPLLESISASASPMRACPPQTIANLPWAFARLGNAHGPLMAALSAAASPTRAEDEESSSASFSPSAAIPQARSHDEPRPRWADALFEEAADDLVVEGADALFVDGGDWPELRPGGAVGYGIYPNGESAEWPELRQGRGVDVERAAWPGRRELRAAEVKKTTWLELLEDDAVVPAAPAKAVPAEVVVPVAVAATGQGINANPAWTVRRMLRKLRSRAVRPAGSWGYCSDDDREDDDHEDEAMIQERLRAARAEPGELHRLEPWLRQVVASEGVRLGGDFFNAMVGLCARAGNCESTVFWVDQASKRRAPLSSSCRRAALECFKAQMEGEVQKVEAARRVDEVHSEHRLYELAELVATVENAEQHVALPSTPVDLGTDIRSCATRIDLAEQLGRSKAVFISSTTVASSWPLGRRAGSP